MSESDYKKYWYIKLPKEFFNRHDIKILESQTNGKDYCLFYLKLLLESVTHNGELRFNETIPYDEDMLSVVTNTNVDVVRSAMKVLHQLKLIEIYEDKTIFMTEVNKMLGFDTGKALRMREYRKQKQLGCSNEPQTSREIELEKELEKDKELDLKEKEEKENLDTNFIKEHLNYNPVLDDEEPSDTKVFYSEINKFIKENNLEHLNPVRYYTIINTENIDNWQEYLRKENAKVDDR